MAPDKAAALKRALLHLKQADFLMGELRGQPCTVIAADGTLGDVQRRISWAINDLEA